MKPEILRRIAIASALSIGPFAGLLDLCFDTGRSGRLHVNDILSLSSADLDSALGTALGWALLGTPFVWGVYEAVKYVIYGPTQPAPKRLKEPLSPSSNVPPEPREVSPALRIGWFWDFVAIIALLGIGIVLLSKNSVRVSTPQFSDGRGENRREIAEPNDRSRRAVKSLEQLQTEQRAKPK